MIDIEQVVDSILEDYRFRIKLERLHPDAKAPIYATKGAAGADIFACNDEPIEIRPGETALIPLGFAMEINEGYGAFLLPRSGLGIKTALSWVT